MDTNQPFVINNRFLIDPIQHSFKDLEIQSEVRLELRHISLLGQLCKNNGKVVGRVFLIGEIWNNYSGADESLTQAISILRKLLVDEKKELIKTIPKKGYIFQAQISHVQQEISKAGSRPSEKKNFRIWLSSILAVIVLGTLLIVLRPWSEQKYLQQREVESKKFNYTPAPREDKESREKHTSPPPEGKDDAKKTNTNK